MFNSKNDGYIDNTSEDKIILYTEPMLNLYNSIQLLKSRRRLYRLNASSMLSGKT